MKRSSKEGKKEASDVSQEEMSGEESNHPPTLIFSGLAQLPAKAGAPHGFSALAVELAVDPHDMRIVDIGSNCLPPIGEKLLISLLIRRKIESGIEDAIREIQARYFSVIQRAVIAALEDILRRYADFQKMKENTSSTS